MNFVGAVSMMAGGWLVSLSVGEPQLWVNLNRGGTETVGEAKPRRNLNRGETLTVGET